MGVCLKTEKERGRVKVRERVRERLKESRDRESERVTTWEGEGGER